MAALLAVAVAAVAAVYLLVGRGDDGYRVRMRFQNASQLVKGNLVQVSGRPIGSVEDITLTRDGEAEVITKIDSRYQPLREGTRALVRATSLSGIANRYIDLQLAPATAKAIPDNGVITADDTTTAVDLDEIFNVFGPRERRYLQGVIRGFGSLYTGRQAQTNRAMAYLNPSVAATSRLTRELAFDEPGLRNFVTQSANLVTDLDQRRSDLAALIQNLAQTTGAIANRDNELQSALSQLPGFMRRANTTFVNLRATLDDLDPLVEESKPVAKKLRPFLAQLRPLANDARPTLDDLNHLIEQPGENNDLIEATDSNIKVRNIAVNHVHRNGKDRAGAFPASIDALRASTPELNYAKAYAVDLTGWFDDFSHSGYYDALGSVGRVPLHLNIFTIINGLPSGCGALPIPCTFAPAIVQQTNFLNTAQVGMNNRCPGSDERDYDGSNPYIPKPLRKGQPGGCDPDQVPQGN